MRRLAYAVVFLVVIGALVGGVLIVPGRHSGTNLLVQAAYAMGASDSLHVRGDRNLADEYSPWNSEPGSYEFWFSPEGFRQDWYDKDGALVRSLGGIVATGQAWQYFPDQSSGKGSLFTYRLSPDQLTAYVQVNRERFANGQLRVAEIAERGHAWTEAAGEWQGKPVSVVVEELTPALVTGEQRGTIEYYLGQQTGALVGMAQYGPSAEGRPLRASVDLIEYNLEIPQDVFQSDAPASATVRDGRYAVRPSGDIAFYPGADTMTQSLLGSALESRHQAIMGTAPWEEVERRYLSVLKEDPENDEARLYLGRLYTRWGLFEEALDLLPSGDGYWGDLNRAFCLDALGHRQEAVAIYEKLKNVGHDSVAEWARLGLERPTWPLDLDIKPEPGEFLLKPRPEWRASASSSSAETTPQAAIDGDPGARWATGSEQAPGQWFSIDFGSRVRVSRIALDHWGVKCYDNGWARGARALVTEDGVTWKEVPISQGGPQQAAIVSLSPPQLVRGIRFELTKQHSPEWWVICELYVFCPTG
jgi:tetratricopeptide (TPR) repeat protein